MKNKLKVFTFLGIILFSLSSCGENKPSYQIVSTGLNIDVIKVEELVKEEI